MDFFSVQISEIMTNWSEGLANHLEVWFLLQLLLCFQNVQGKWHVFMWHVLQGFLLYIITAPGKDLQILQSVGKLVRCVKLTFYCDNAYTVRIHAWTHTPWITWHVYRGKECSCPAVCAALSLNTSVKLQCSPPVQSYWTAWGFLTNCPCIFDKQKAPALMHFWATLAPRLLSA